MDEQTDLKEKAELKNDNNEQKEQDTPEKSEIRLNQNEEKEGNTSPEKPEEKNENGPSAIIQYAGCFRTFLIARSPVFFYKNINK